jgi:hypothetical protein
MIEDAAPPGDTTSDLKAEVQIEAEGGIEVVFIR